MKVAVTGAGGFIGRHVLKALEQEAGVDVVASGRAESRPGHLDPAWPWVPLAIDEPADDAYGRLGQPDVVIHLAWGGLPNYRSLHHFESELPAQYLFLSGLVHAGLPSLLCTGTCFEYGMRSGKLDEATGSQPANPYGFAKDALRRELSFLRDSTPFAFTWARLFYTYGDGQAATALYPQFMAAGRRGDLTFAMSAGEQLRDYLPVQELASMLVALALRTRDIGIVNVCSGRPVSVRSLTERWAADNAFSMTLDLGRFPYPDHEPMAFWGDDTKLKEALQPHGRA